MTVRNNVIYNSIFHLPLWKQHTLFSWPWVWEKESNLGQGLCEGIFSEHFLLQSNSCHVVPNSSALFTICCWVDSHDIFWLDVSMNNFFWTQVVKSWWIICLNCVMMRHWHFCPSLHYPSSDPEVQSSGRYVLCERKIHSTLRCCMCLDLNVPVFLELQFLVLPGKKHFCWLWWPPPRWFQCWCIWLPNQKCLNWGFSPPWSFFPVWSLDKGGVLLL